MKYLLLIVILFVAYNIWRNNRIAERGVRDEAARRAALGQPQDMVCCPVCSVHLPRSEAVKGAHGLL